MKFVLDFRTSDRGGAVVPGRLSSPTANGHAALDQLRAAGRIAFLVHGFNVTRPHGLERLGRFADQLAHCLDWALVSVVWPGDAWIPGINYVVEGRDADDTAAEFAKFLRDGLPARPTLSFATHSLGARVALETLRRLGDEFEVGQLCLMASAVDDDCLSDIYSDVTSRARRVAVLSSVEDNVLRSAYPLGDLFQAFLFPTTDKPGVALGYQGPRPVAGLAHLAIPQVRAAGHGDYLPAFGAPLNAEQASAAGFADDVLIGASPVYR